MQSKTGSKQNFNFNINAGQMGCVFSSECSTACSIIFNIEMFPVPFFAKHTVSLLSNTNCTTLNFTLV